MAKKSTTKEKIRSAAAHIPHADLRHVSSECVRTFIDRQPGPSLTVTTALLFDLGTIPRSYRVTLRRESGATSSLPYSLFALGVQGRRWKVKIISATGLDVVVWELGANRPVRVSGIAQSVGAKMDPAENKHTGVVEESRLWFINFSSECCELKVESYRPKPHKLAKGIVNGHDVAPPPPEGGGDDGDAE